MAESAISHQLEIAWRPTDKVRVYTLNRPLQPSDVPTCTWHPVVLGKSHASNLMPAVAVCHQAGWLWSSQRKADLLSDSVAVGYRMALA